MTEEKETTNKTSFFNKIWQRKVPQYLGTYFAIGFGLLQFFEFLIKRYNLNLSNVLLDKYLLVWLAMVPAIVLIIYYGADLKFKSTRLKWPKIFVIGNIMAVLGIAFFVNNTSENKGISVELMNENNEKVQKEIPVLNKIKTIANFQFKNETGSIDNDWYGVAFSNLLQLDLDQRPELYAYSAYTLNSYHNELGLPSYKTPPIGMQREIAKKSRNDFFTDISYAFNDTNFEFKGHLYTAKDGKKVKELKAVSTDFYAAIDDLKNQIIDYFSDLGSDANQTYLPSSSLLTANQDALKYHTLSQIGFSKDPTALVEGLKLEQKAAELDPSCGTCYYYIGSYKYGMGKTDEALVYIKKAIQYNKALPERMQFYAKQSLYTITNNLDAYWKLQEMRRNQFPYEFAPYSNLISYYKSNFGIDSTKSLINEAINNGNLERGLLALYDLQLENKEYDEALTTLKKCSTAFPDRDQDRLKYATIYERQGRLEEAKKLLIQEEALDPLNPNIQVRIATLDFKNTDFESANKRVDIGMEQATNLIDTLSYVWFKSYIFENTGQVKATSNLIADYENYAVRRTPTNRVKTSTFTRKAILALNTGAHDVLQTLFEDLETYNSNSVGTYRCMVNSIAIIRDLDPIIKSADLNTVCKNEYQHYGAGAEDYIDLLVSYQSQDYQVCMNILEKEDGKVEKLVDDSYFFSNIYMKAGRPKKAITILKNDIDQKTDQPIIYYQLAKLLADSEPENAQKYLNVALKFWENADVNYIPYQRAISLSKELGVYQENKVL